MADFIMNCPQCGKPMTVKDEWLNQQVTCPSCQQIVTVSKPDATPDNVLLNPILEPQPSFEPQQNDFHAQQEQAWVNSLDLENIAKKLKLTFKGYWAALILSFVMLVPLIASFILLAIGIAGLGEKGSDSLSVLAIIGLVIMFIFGLLLIIFLVLSTVCTLTHHYFVWKLLRPWQMPAGPLATVLLLLIPFFSIYWNFRSIGDQATLIANELGPAAKSTVIAAKGKCYLPLVNILMMVLMPIFALLSAIPYIGQVISLIQQILSSVINLATIVFNIWWFIAVHKNALTLVEIRRQAQINLFNPSSSCARDF